MAEVWLVVEDEHARLVPRCDFVEHARNLVRLLLADEELAALVDEVLAAEGLDSPKQMGQAMKAVMARVAGRAEGRRVADVVKAKLAGG